jgi:hypothetical protein
VLALQVPSDGFKLVRGRPFREQLAVSVLAFRLGSAQGKVHRVPTHVRVVPSACVGSVTGPPVVGRHRDHASANRVHLDIAVAAKQVGFAVDQTRLVATFEELPVRW